MARYEGNRAFLEDLLRLEGDLIISVDGREWKVREFLGQGKRHFEKGQRVVRMRRC